MSDSFHIEQARSTRDLRAVILFPWQLYRNDPCWAPPVISDRLARFDPATNPMLRHGEAQAFIARRDGRIVGTVAAAIDYELNKVMREPFASLGFFECVNDYAVAEALLTVARDWARARHAPTLRGPYNFTPNDEPGLLVEGRDRPPVILCSHTQPYYLEFVERFGFHKWGPDEFCYGLSVTDYRPDLSNLPPKLLRVVEAVRKRSGAIVRPIRLDDWDNELGLAHGIYNKSLAVLPDFTPLDADEFRRQGKAMRPLVDADLAMFVEIDGKPVGFVLALPDINEALLRCNGLRYPWNYLQLWWRTRRLRGMSFKIIALDPDYWGRGLDALMYFELARNTVRKGFTWIDMSLTGEDNPQTNKLASLFDARVYKRYRIFQLEL
jgi:GNAT superfamily N-acetyltransferase